MILSKASMQEVPAFYQRYVLQLPDKPILQLLMEQAAETQLLFSKFSEEMAEKPYAPGKWSAKQLLGHLNDTERIMVYRALCISRGETLSLPGFDENAYVTHSNFNEQLLGEMLKEYWAIRQGTQLFFQNMNADMALRIGEANQVPFSARVLATVIVAHERHHLNIIQERYLPLCEGG